MAEPLFLLTDTVVVGRLPAPALGALGVASTVLSFLVGLCVFLAYGTTAAVARQIGAGETGRALRQGVDGLWLAAGVGLAIIVVVWPLAPSLVHLLGAEGELAQQAVTYLRISLLGVPAMLLVFAGTGVLRGMQDTATPLLVSVGAFALNAVLNIVFVLRTGLGDRGLGVGHGTGPVARRRRLSPPDPRPVPSAVPPRPGGRAGGGLGRGRSDHPYGVPPAGAGRRDRRGHPHGRAADRGAHRRHQDLDPDGVRPGRDRHRRAGDHRPRAGRRRRGGSRGATGRMVVWGIGSGVLLGLLIVLARPFVPALFDAGPVVAAELLDLLWVVAVLQPVAGVVFVLDGVLIGAGDRRYLAWAGGVDDDRLPARRVPGGPAGRRLVRSGSRSGCGWRPGWSPCRPGRTAGRGWWPAAEPATEAAGWTRRMAEMAEVTGWPRWLAGHRNGATAGGSPVTDGVRRAGDPGVTLWCPPRDRIALVRRNSPAAL
ncbi:MATE family efflux transporter [Streptosporangium vulgare]|uniref:MATE family efflux transporter n=1 Tax=Streptosporangium vulgare TaxID=46190 RepID=UPI0031DE8DA1